MTFLSIIIPTYNHDYFLPRAINSILQQQYPDIEIIVVDNSSSDSTYALVESYYDHRVKYLPISNHGIISRSRNLGLANASGEWVCFLDSDDFWYSDKLSTLMPYLKAETYDVISSNEYIFNSKSHHRSLLSYGFGDAKTNHSSLLLRRNCLSPSATIISKAFLDKFSVSFSESRQFIGAEDYDFWLTLALSNARFFHCSSIGGEYLIHGNNVSSRILSHSCAVLMVKLKHLKLGNFGIFAFVLVLSRHIASTVYMLFKQAFHLFT